MKTKDNPTFVANDISFALNNKPDTQYVLTLMVKRMASEVLANGASRTLSLISLCLILLH